MQDLNDLQLFALVVRHGGFAAAERASGEAKSKLSKRVARLEASYGARLIERSTRSFRVTDIGRDVYRQCEAIIERLEATDAIVARARDEVSGCLRISSPPGLMQYYNSHLLLGFMARYPDVRVQLLIHERHVDLINEKIDVAFRITSHFDQDQSLIKRDLGVRQRILVAGAQLVEKAGSLPQSFEQLASLPTLSMGEWLDRDRWEFEDNAGNQRTFVHVPGCVAGITARCIVRRLPGWASRFCRSICVPTNCERVNCCVCCRSGVRRAALFIWCSPAAKACCRRCGRLSITASRYSPKPIAASR
ncbi:LysR substrate-binding domain-containing protein [Serratia ureilytica]